jgi:hypothetical protein
LYYVRDVDPTLIMPINVLASEKSRATAIPADNIIKLLNYCNTQPETKIRYHASGMILHIHSDASYLSEKEAKIRAGGFFYMGISINRDKKLTSGAILIISTVLKHQGGSSPSNNIGRIKAPSSPHTNGDRQYHSHRLKQWHNKTKTHKSNGCAFLLDQRQSKTRAL